MARSRFDIAKKNIIAYFNNNASKIFTFNDISVILTENNQFWNLPKKLTVHGFIDDLIRKTELKEFDFSFPTGAVSRYVWGEVPILPIVLTLKPRAYFSHYTAMYIHNLTEQMPKSIYLNAEQGMKPIQEASLKQENVDKAFSRQPRATNTVAKLDDYTVYLLNGKHTGRLGVEEYIVDYNNKLYVTNLERTLIDIVVRPGYSGGVAEVLKAYERATGKVSVNRIAALLTELKYIYPYHQAIGFYLEKSGVYKDSQIRLLDQFEKKVDFYITYQMKETEYSKRWKLYYPKNF